MNLDLVWFILIGLAAGWLAGQLLKGGGFGLLGDIAVGTLGAVVGGFVFRAAGVSVGGGLVGSLVVATFGAIALLLLVRMVRRA